MSRSTPSTSSTRITPTGPGTGTPEIGGLTTIQALEIIRGCRGLALVGVDCVDCVEVSPPDNTTGNTAISAANLMYEMLCVLPGVQYRASPDFQAIARRCRYYA